MFASLFLVMLLHTVIKTIRRHSLFSRGEHVLVGVSGGADSVALLAVLREMAPLWKFRLTVAHLNHGIRGAAAAEDAAFVADLARRWKLDFVGSRINVPLQARQRGISLEMAGRAARYEFFAKAARAHHCDVVATAHTADDQAETILLNLARGAGAAGIAGIPYMGWHDALKSGLRQRCRSVLPGRSALMKPGERQLQVSGVEAVRKNRSESARCIKVVRPLRDASRKSIERFLTSRHLTWREDATNADPAFLRNRVRHEVLPFLEKRLNPGIRLALLRAGDILSGENEWLNGLAEEILEHCCEAGAGHNITNRKWNRGVEPVLHRLSLPEDSRHKAGSTSNNHDLSAPNLNAEQLAVFPMAARRRVLRRWLEACGLDAEMMTFDAIERLDNLVADCRGGRSVTLSRGWSVSRHGGGLTLSMDGQRKRNPGSCAGDGADLVGHSRRGFQPRSAGKRQDAASTLSFSVCLAVPGETRLPDQDCRITASIGPGIDKEKSKAIGAMPARASLSLRVWRKRRLTARSWKPGDRMRPLGMLGSKKLQDIFSDGKVPPALRHRLPVIECQGEIIWIPGFRIARGWAVGPDEPKALQLVIEPTDSRAVNLSGLFCRCGR